MKNPPVTPPLFDTPVQVVTKAKTRSIASVAWGNCPGCRKGRVGIIRGAFHLMWREHSYRTWGGALITCPSSGVPVCQLHERIPTVLIRGRVLCDCEPRPHAITHEGGAAA